MMQGRNLFRVAKPPRAALPGRTSVTAPTMIFGVLDADKPEWRIGIPPSDGTLHGFVVEYQVPDAVRRDENGVDIEWPPVTLEVWTEQRGIRIEALLGADVYSAEKLEVKAGGKMRMLAKCPPGAYIWVGAVFEASQSIWLKQEGTKNAQDIQQGLGATGNARITGAAISVVANSSADSSADSSANSPIHAA
jgi:hypothetical protein